MLGTNLGYFTGLWLEDQPDPTTVRPTMRLVLLKMGLRINFTNSWMAAFIQSQKDLAKQSTRQNENQAVFQAQMLEVVQKVGQPQAKEYDLNELVEKFRKRFPPEFHGIEDPTVADEWVVQMEKIYEVFKCTGFQQVQLAAHMFRGAAERW